MRRATPSAPTSGGIGRRLLRGVVGTLVVAVALLHLRLLWQQVSDQSVLEPWLAAKWLTSALLVAALWRLKAAGLRLFSGKRAGVIWLLALLLHVQLPVAPVITPAVPQLEPAGWLLALPVGVSMGAALALALGLVLAVGAAASPHRSIARARVSTLRLAGALPGLVPALSSRPPPVIS